MPSLKMTLTADKKNADWMKLFDQWEDRVDAILEEFPRRIAHDVLAAIVSGAPQGRIKGYPDMLEIRQLPDTDGWKIVGILPPSWAFDQRLRAVDVPRTVLYVRPRMRAGVAVSDAAVILSQSNPWTMDTLPYEPSKSEASIVSRQVTEREARFVEQEQQRKRPQTEIELRNAGVGDQLRPKNKVLLTRKVSRDIAFEVCRAEFGNGVDGQPQAHWRPALRKVSGVISRKHFKDLLDWLADPEERRYLRVKEEEFERASSMERVQRFQDLVAPSTG